MYSHNISTIQFKRRILQCHQKEQRNYHLSLLHCSPFQVFCASTSTRQKSFTASAQQFQVSFSASNGTTLCHCKWGQRNVVCPSRRKLTCHRTVLIYIDAVSQTQLRHDQGLFPLWGAIKKDILPEFCSVLPAGLNCRSSRTRILHASPVFHGSTNLPVRCGKDRHSSQPVFPSLIL